MKPGRFNELTKAYANLRVAVVGDFCLDRYLEIDPARSEVSIETGLEVYNVINVRSQPGGSGTILNNLEALGCGHLFPVGFAGEDGEGYELTRSLAQSQGVDLRHFFQTSDRRTFTYCKPLVLAKGASPRELNRLDSKNLTPTPVSVQERLAKSISELAGEVDAMVLLEQVDMADTGVLAGQVLIALRQAQKDYPKLLILADSRRGFAHLPNIALKMNRDEFTAMTGVSTDQSVDALGQAIEKLANDRGHAVFVSLSEEGILGALPGIAAEHVAGLPCRGEIDIVGAGDAVMANLALALASGATAVEAMRLAMAAASVVIHQLGTTGVASIEDLAPLVVDA